MKLEGFAKPGSKEADLLKLVDGNRLPKHVAVIMDGNGRWARMRKLPRIAGHRAGHHRKLGTARTASTYPVCIFSGELEEAAQRGSYSHEVA